MAQTTVNSPLPNANKPETQARFLKHVLGPNPARFRIGDGVSFAKMDGQNWPLMILGIEGNDVEAMCWDGNPHLVHLKLDDLLALRVIGIQEADHETVDMYRRLVGLPVEEWEE